MARVPQGPHADEAPTINALHDFIDRNGHQMVGKHHEIYVSDPRKADPAKDAHHHPPAIHRRLIATTTH